MSYLAPFNRSHAFGWSVPEVVVGLCIERSLAMLVGCSASSYARARDVGCHAKAFGRPSRCSVTWSKTWAVASRAV